MSQYLNDPREDVLRSEFGGGYYLEEDNREEMMYKWGARVLDLCDLPVSEYMKPMTVITEGGGGGGGDTGVTPTLYALTFYVNGSAQKQYSLEAGDSIPNYDVSEEGYDVTEWADVNGNTYTTMPSKRLKLYCTKTKKTFTVNFVIDNVLVSSTTVAYNEYPSQIPSTTKTGFEFSGWDPDVNSTRITADTVFNGSYTIKQYTLTWSINGTTTQEVYDYGETINYPEVDIEGYTLVRWSSNPETMPANNLTITAVLQINSYKLSFSKIVGNDEILISSSNVQYNSAIVLPNLPQQQGYSYTDWASDAAYSKMPAHDVEYVTTETKNRYNLHYLVDNEEVNSIEYEYLETVVKQPKYTKPGYTVTDWYGEPDTMPYNDVSATCETSINYYDLTIKDENNNTIAVVNVEYGTNISDIMLDYPGYSYTGQTTQVLEDTEIDVTTNSYDVLIVVNGENNTVSLPYGSNLKSNVEDFVEENYSDELIGHHITMDIDENATVEIEDNVVNVTLEPNIHTVNADGTLVSIAYGETILDKLPEPQVSEGYELTGWNYEGGNPIGPNDVMGDEDILVYPVIVQIQRDVVLVIDGVTGSPVSYVYGTTLSSIISNADLGEKGNDNGYEQVWTVNGEPYSEGMTVGTENIVLECEFVKKSFILSFYNSMSTPYTLISSANTEYKSIIGNYPEMPNVEIGDTEYEFVWSGESLTGTEMPAHDVDVYGQYSELQKATDVYYGFKYNTELSGELDNIEDGLINQEIASINPNSIITVPVDTADSIGRGGEYDEYYGEDENFTTEWNETYAFSILVIVPEQKAITSFKQGTTEAPNWAGNSSYETYYGTTEINGFTYKVYGYRDSETGYIVADGAPIKGIYISIE